MNREKYNRDKRSPTPSSALVSKIMSRIKAKDTKPEIKLRKSLWSLGLRYRIHDKDLPGTPDIVIKKYKLAIFVDGDFWHGKDWQISKFKIKNNATFWRNKIEKNIERDIENNRKLIMMGFSIIRFWSSEVEKEIGPCVYQILLAVNCNKEISDYMLGSDCR